MMNRIRKLEETRARAQKPQAFANNWPCYEPAEMRDKWRVRWENEPYSYESVFGEEREYTYTLPELQAEAERRGVELVCIQYIEWGNGAAEAAG